MMNGKMLLGDWEQAYDDLKAENEVLRKAIEETLITLRKFHQKYDSIDDYEYIADDLIEIEQALKQALAGKEATQ